MFDTHVTVVGNVLHEPEWRRTVNTGALVTTFKIASTARRLNRETGQWMDGNSLRVRVTCWRSLASNVRNSVTRGDPLIVTGRLFTRDWIDEQGVRRTQYELEASAVGHDLNRGRSIFERQRANTSTSAVEDPRAEVRVGGELTAPVPDHRAPSQFNPTPYEAAEDLVARGYGSPGRQSGGPAGYQSGGTAGGSAVPGALGSGPDDLSPVPEDEPVPGRSGFDDGDSAAGDDLVAADDLVDGTGTGAGPVDGLGSEFGDGFSSDLDDGLDTDAEAAAEPAGRFSG